MREIGVTCSGQRGGDDAITLADAKFQIGDYLDINISPSNRKPEQRSRDNRDRRPY
jgi:histone deacetylase complex subunit SAP18